MPVAMTPGGHAQCLGELTRERDGVSDVMK